MTRPEISLYTRGPTSHQSISLEYDGSQAKKDIAVFVQQRDYLVGITVESMLALLQRMQLENAMLQNAMPQRMQY